jgi:hypothetical protein
MRVDSGTICVPRLLASVTIGADDRGMIRRCLLACTLVLLGASQAFADTPRTIVWKDLLPEGPVLADPLAHLTVNQRIELRLVAVARERQERGYVDDGDRGKLAARNLTRKLRDQGLDIDALLAQFAAYRAKMLERNRTTNAGIDGQRVRLKGYLLPLVESEETTRDFLLVPFVGACIHVPPPPANQVVAIRAQTPFKPPGLFTPVWITGRMDREMATKVLYLVDGRAAVPSGYAMDAERIALDRD